MARVRIEHLSDSNYCETCGTSYADGARIIVDGQEAVCLEPFADCTDPAHFDSEDILRALLKHFGHELETPPVPTSNEYWRDTEEA